MTPAQMTPAQALAELSRQGLLSVLEAALKRYRRTGELGCSRPELSSEAWLALSRLTGQASRNRLDLALLNDALKRSRYAVELPAVLEALNGEPIVVKRQARETLEARWKALLAGVSDADWQKALSRDEAGAALLRAELKQLSEFQYERTDKASLHSLLDQSSAVDDAWSLDQNSAVGDAADQLVQLVSEALRVARSETLSFPVLAARLTGDAHALDTGSSAGNLFRAVLHALKLPSPLRDGVSSSVLIANVRGPDWLNALAGHRLALPWREIQAMGAVYVAENMLWVVENPSVFEALHTVCPQAPLLCTSGQPKAATMALLARLPAHTTAYLSCDLDLGGLRIAAHLMKNLPLNWKPWQMDASAHALASGRGVAPLKGDPAPYARQFPGLVTALIQSGHGAHQENLLPELLADIRATST